MEKSLVEIAFLEWFGLVGSNVGTKYKIRN